MSLNAGRTEGMAAEVNRARAAGRAWHGSGGIVASISAADAVNGVPFEESVEEAASCVRTCISASVRLGIPEQEGVCFENFLGQLADGGFPSN